MQSCNLLFTTVVLLFLGISGNAVCQEMISEGSQTIPPPREERTTVLPRDEVQIATDKLVGFNLLSNKPPVPDFDMHDEAGSPVTFASFQGKVVLFNLWATWCPPCIREMPELNALQALFKDHDFVVVPVASGHQGNEEPAEFLRKHGLNELTTYYDPNSQFLRIFDLETLPITFLIDRDGNMRGGVLGMLDWSSAEAKALIEAFLDEKKT